MKSEELSPPKNKNILPEIVTLASLCIPRKVEILINCRKADLKNQLTVYVKS